MITCALYIMGAFPSLRFRNDDCWAQGKTTPDHKTHSMGVYLCQDFKSSATSKDSVSDPCSVSTVISFQFAECTLIFLLQNKRYLVPAKC